ncbi:MAG: hypothetical protein NXI22_03280 [bacterium]|nr:hypothetical protein [bacterium]
MFPVEIASEGSDPIVGKDDTLRDLLIQLVEGQQRQNELLEEMLHQQQAQQRQRASDLRNWRQSNPALAKECRSAVEALSSVQNQFLFRMAEDIQDSAEELSDGGFMLNEFVDRYGPRIAHLNGVMQILSQLGGNSAGRSSE